MTPDRFRECLRLLDWSQRGVADLLGIDPRQVRRWASDDASIPEPVASWLDTLAGFHARHPPPSGRVHAPRSAVGA